MAITYKSNRFPARLPVVLLGTGVAVLAIYFLFLKPTKAPSAEAAPAANQVEPAPIAPATPEANAVTLPATPAPVEAHNEPAPAPTVQDARSISSSGRTSTSKRGTRSAAPSPATSTTRGAPSWPPRRSPSTSACS